MNDVTKARIRYKLAQAELSCAEKAFKATQIESQDAWMAYSDIAHKSGICPYCDEARINVACTHLLLGRIKGHDPLPRPTDYAGYIGA